MGVDFLVSPRCYQLYASALRSSQSTVPEDWKEQLARAVEDLPEDITVHELIKTVAALSPDRARTLIQDAEERRAEQEKVEDTIEQNLAEKKFLMAEIKELREQRAVLQSRMDDGCELDLEEELRKARRENQLLRDHYTHLCSLVEQQEPRSPCTPSRDY